MPLLLVGIRQCQVPCLDRVNGSAGKILCHGFMLHNKIQLMTLLPPIAPENLADISHMDQLVTIMGKFSRIM